MKGYLRSNEYILPLYKEAIENFVASGVDPSIPEAMFALRESDLNAAFDEMQTEYGSINDYFSEGLDINASMQEKLRALYIDHE